MRRDTPDPRRSRTRALKILFDADVRGEHPRDRLAAVDEDPRALDLLDEVDLLDAVEAVDAGVEPPDGPREAAALRRARARPVRLDPFTRRLVGGVADELAGLDAVLEDHAIDWRVSRMPVIDRNVLRLAVWELAHEDTPVAVVFDEALELTRAWSTERAVTFVNGVLAAVRRLGDDELRERLAAAAAVADEDLDDHLLDPDAVAAEGGAAEVTFEDLLFAEDVGDHVEALLGRSTDPAGTDLDGAGTDGAGTDGAGALDPVPEPGVWLVRLDSSPDAARRTGHWPDVLSRRAGTRLPVGPFASADRAALESLPDGAWVVAYQEGVDPDARERPEGRLVGLARVRRPRPSEPSAAAAGPPGARPAVGASDVPPPPTGVASRTTSGAPSGAQTDPSGAHGFADPPVHVVGARIVPGDEVATPDLDGEPVDGDGRERDDDAMVLTRAARQHSDTRPGHAAPVAPPPLDAAGDPAADTGPVVVLEAVGSFLPYVALDDIALDLAPLRPRSPAVQRLDAAELDSLRATTDEAVTAGTRGPLGLRLRRFGDTTIGSAAPAEDDDARRR